MKRNIFLLTVLLFGCLFIQAQKNIPKGSTFYDENFEPLKSKKGATYYRTPPVLENGLYHINDYYMSGAMQWDAYTKDKEGDIIVGKCTWYNEDGSISQKGIYKDGDDVELTLFYEGTTNISEKQIIKDGFTIKEEAFYPNGKIRENTSFKDDGFQTVYYDTKGKKMGEFNYTGEKFVGTSYAFYPDGENIYSKTVFNKEGVGVLIQTFQLDGYSTITKYHPETGDEISSEDFDDKGRKIEQ